MDPPPKQRRSKKITGFKGVRQGGKGERGVKCLRKYPTTRKEEWKSIKASKLCHQFGHTTGVCKVLSAENKLSAS